MRYSPPRLGFTPAVTNRTRGVRLRTRPDVGYEDNDRRFDPDYPEVTGKDRCREPGQATTPEDLEACLGYLGYKYLENRKKERIRKGRKVLKDEFFERTNLPRPPRLPRWVPRVVKYVLSGGSVSISRCNGGAFLRSIIGNYTYTPEQGKRKVSNMIAKAITKGRRSRKIIAYLTGLILDQYFPTKENIFRTQAEFFQSIQEHDDEWHRQRSFAIHDWLVYYTPKRTGLLARSYSDWYRGRDQNDLIYWNSAPYAPAVCFSQPALDDSRTVPQLIRACFYHVDNKVPDSSLVNAGVLFDSFGESP